MANTIADIVNLCPSDGSARMINFDKITGNIIITSDARSGCFYQRVALSDETGYIEVLVDTKGRESRFPVGARVSFICSGLYVWTWRNVVVVGNIEVISYPDGETVKEYPPLSTPSELSRIQVLEQTDLRPRDGEIWNPTARKEGDIVYFDDVQFTDDYLGQAWGDYRSRTDLFRHIVDREGNTFPVMVPSYAWFAYRMLPSGSGRIEGLMQRSRRIPYQYLKVFDARKIHMEGERFEVTPKGPFLSGTELMWS